MNKKQLNTAFALLSSIVFCFSAAGCQNAPHSHKWKNEYAYDSETHWLECGDCKEKKDVDRHALSSPSCNVCGYNFSPTEGIVYELSDDAMYATVVEYNGTDTNVIISPIHEGAPVIEIKEYAFADGNSLTNIIIPDCVQTIGKFAFEGCSSLTKLTIPSSVRSIGENAFLNCNNITELTLPFVGASIDSQENSHIGHLFGCDSESHQAHVPASLKRVTITNATFIGDYAFRYCKSLAEIIIPRTVTHIGYAAFYTCDSLKSIFIPSTVSTIKNYAFAYCYDITIYCEAESQPHDWDPTWNYGFPVVWGSKE